MTIIRITARLILLALVLAPQIVWGQLPLASKASLLGPSITNTQKNTINTPTVAGGLIAFRVSEAGQSADLNGDGDTSDTVLHYYDSKTRITTNLGLATVANTRPLIITPTIAGKTQQIIIFLVEESAQGVDINGDGDSGDRLLHLHYVGIGTTLFKHPISSGKLYAAQADLVFCAVTEAGAGLDLNGDGDTADEVVHLFDPRSNTVTNLGLALGKSSTSVRLPYSINENRLAIAVSEADQGGQDLNGDGDATDEVIHLYSAGGIRNLGLAVFDAGSGQTALKLRGDLLAFGVSESGHNGADLNGDSDAADYVMHLYRISTGLTTNLAKALTGGLIVNRHFNIYGDLVAFPVREFSQGAVLNGDGDMLDDIQHVHDASTGTTYDLGLAIQLGTKTLAGMPQEVIFLVPESEQGADLDGDGLTASLVAHVFHKATGKVSNLQLAATRIEDSDKLAALVVPEAGPGSLADHNGDGDTSDFVVFLYHYLTGKQTNTRLALPTSGGKVLTSAPLALDGNFVLLGVFETDQFGVDLNADGDANDTILHVYAAGTGAKKNLTLAVVPGAFIPFAGGLAAARAREKATGTDLNGDGDMVDFIVHAVKFGK